MKHLITPYEINNVINEPGLTARLEANDPILIAEPCRHSLVVSARNQTSLAYRVIFYSYESFII